MEQAIFYVKGSASKPYRVTIERDGTNLNAYCTCAAGSHGMCCKHRLRIFSGNPEGMLDPDLDLLRSIVDWIVGTDVELALIELARAEDEFDAAKESLRHAQQSSPHKLQVRAEKSCEGAFEMLQQANRNLSNALRI